jgi:hypothetical protein
MAIFNVAFLNPRMRKKSGGTGVSILGHQLTMLENELEKDGYLAPGDYDLLIERARSIQKSGALTPTQRSSYDVKISGYQKNKELSSIEKTGDIERMNRSVESEAIEDVMVAGNNPNNFITGRIASLESKIGSLLNVIQKREIAGMDTTEHLNEYQEAMREYTSRNQTLQSLESFDGKNPIAGQAAFVKTNVYGEIIDVDYAAYGSKSGYVETNGMINGLSVYGKVNDKKDGKNLFFMGGSTFSAPDIMEADPENPGQFKPTKLVADVKQLGPFKIGEAGYVNMDSKSLRVQSYLPRNSWSKGLSGTIYKRRQDGGYTKYLNLQSRADYGDMPNPEDMMKIHPNIENSIMRSGVDETVDFAEMMEPEEETMMAPMETVGPMAPETFTQKGPLQPRQGVSRATTRRTPQQPKEQASPGIVETAKRTFQGGVDYLKGVFR